MSQEDFVFITNKYLFDLLVYNLSKSIFLGAKFSNYTYLLALTCTYEKYVNYKGNIELNINKTIESNNNNNNNI